jgi:hypothetical protein
MIAGWSKSAALPDPKRLGSDATSKVESGQEPALDDRSVIAIFRQ